MEKEILWCCHVRGPDDVHAAPDYETALKWADQINELIVQRDPPLKWTHFHVAAVPALWPWSAESHAESMPKAIHDNTPRNQLPPDDPDYRAGPAA